MLSKKNACAEISSILAIESELKKSLKDDETLSLTIHLLCTDTILSPLCAEVIAKYLSRKGYMVAFHEQENIVSEIKNSNFKSDFIIRDLRVDSKGNYEKGFMNLIEQLDKLKLGKNDILNITGGYKAIIPILTLYGQLKEIPLKYIYNESELDKTNELVTVGNLPINFDYSIFEDNYIAFESIKPDKKPQNLPSIDEFKKTLEEEKIYDELKNIFLIQVENDKVGLSVLGKMLYHDYENSLKEDGFNMSNLLGKVMEIKVFEFFNKQFPNQTILGKPIGQSPEGSPYDLDVFVETENEVWGIEVKPENVKVLNSEATTDKKSIQYKCEVGAFRCAIDEYKEKLKLVIFMYHHKEPNTYQKDAFLELRSIENNLCKNFMWLWVKPPIKYKGNVNWSISTDNVKQFNFETKTWENYSF